LNATTQIGFRDYGIYGQKTAESIKKAYSLGDRMASRRTSTRCRNEAKEKIGGDRHLALKR
jgi:hypothetical protein